MCIRDRISGALKPTISLIAIAVPMVARLMSSPLATVAMKGEMKRYALLAVTLATVSGVIAARTSSE